MERAEEKWGTREQEERRQRGAEHDKMVMRLVSRVLCHKCQSVIFAYWWTYLGQVLRGDAAQGMEWRWSNQGHRLGLRIPEEGDLVL